MKKFLHFLCCFALVASVFATPHAKVMAKLDVPEKLELKVQELNSVMVAIAPISIIEHPVGFNDVLTLTDHLSHKLGKIAVLCIGERGIGKVAAFALAYERYLVTYDRYKTTAAAELHDYRDKGALTDLIKETYEFKISALHLEDLSCSIVEGYNYDYKEYPDYPVANLSKFANYRLNSKPLSNIKNQAVIRTNC